MILWVILVALIVGADQWVKYLVVTNISGSDIVTAIPGVIDFVYVKNTGAAFSILENNIELLSAISALFCIGVLVYLLTQKPKNKLLILSLAFLFGGAVGNVIDRIFRGYVVDFIETTFINFPVFNIADVAITIGAVLLIIYILFFDKKEQEKLAAALAEEQPAPEAAEPEIAETEAGETDGEKDADGTSA
ncbi:MAG TPA: signal peptidase II [Candidatus Avimonoglobus intestinipullorum]|uniref:Lipoprotein signal peptidase n=1 Tax=Candidatus Avimonoglobus intestinipullorum TaxID=2840699 RepID=A0A9D1LUE3_9FIRM|nr:signal peptidase II [Candidatus Avimonoglobus intestinipullorum]